MKRLSALLIVVALTAAMTSCAVEADPTHRCNLTIASTDGGSVATPGEGTYIYEEGTVVKLVAPPSDGHRFVNWTGDVATVADVNAALTALTVNGDYSITANFEEVPRYNLAISSTDGGSVTTPGEGTFTYDAGVVVSLVAKPDDGYRFVGWTGDAAALANPDAPSTALVMNGNYVITAVFEEEPFTATGCFIATAAYGTPMAEETRILREFRDRYLLTNPLGQALVDIYYTTSPPIAGFITEHPGLKPVVRVGLMPVVVMCSLVSDVVPSLLATRHGESSSYESADLKTLAKERKDEQ